MLLVDTKEKRMIGDVELKKDIALSRPHSAWLKEQVSCLALKLTLKLLQKKKSFFSLRIKLNFKNFISEHLFKILKIFL